MDLEQLISDIKDAASKILKQDITVLRGYSERQLEAIAQQAEFVSVGITNGQITKETEQFFLDGLEDMALSFAKTLRGLLMVTIEKVWNAIVGVLWTAISKAAGVALPVPLIT